MKRIYSAANLSDAHLLRDILERVGITTHLFNQYAMAALGELPMSSAYPQIWLAQPQQEQHARALIAEFERRPISTAPKLCLPCGEANPAEFDICWQCGQTLA